MKKLDINYIKTEFQKAQNYFLGQRYEKVIEKIIILIKKDPYQATFYNYLGISYRQLGKNEKAEKIFLNGLQIFPNSHSIICNLAALYRIMGRYNDSEYYFKRGMEIKSNDFNLLCNYANLKKDLNKNLEALNLYHKAYTINKENETLLINLASAYQIDAEFLKSKKILQEIHIKFPNNTKSDLMYSSIHKYHENDNHREQMIEKLKMNLSKQDKVYLYFAIAKSYSDIKKFSESCKFINDANKLQFELFENYKFKDDLYIFETIKNKFKGTKFKNSDTKEKPDLIFIVGLPRSGTTLTHQIISSHSEIYGAGELPILGYFFSKKIKDKEFINIFFNEQNEYNNTVVKNISKDLERLFKKFSEDIILDKSPLNFLWIGFIKILFPKAKIIHCTRNLKDVALSIYKNYFDGGSIKWGYNQKHLINFIKEYRLLMDFWEEKLPNQIYHLEYENLIRNKIPETKKIINFCNLDWEEQCVDHTKNNTGIKTVSISQARKPIYSSSINLSEKYSEYFPFLEEI
jgi:tetratricopeptide (TPR) repeat protein